MEEANNNQSEEFDWPKFWTENHGDDIATVCAIVMDCPANAIDAELVRFRKALMTGTAQGHQTPENEKILNQAWKLRNDWEAKNSPK